MVKQSAGLLMYRFRQGEIQFLLAHPGGPFWQNKDLGAWTIPKGEVGLDEDVLLAAQREFREEVGFQPEGKFLPLTPVKQKAGKMVQAWAFEGDCDPAFLKSNTFRMEWPPRSGIFRDFPEVDRVEFFELNQAKEKINPAQMPFLEEAARLARRS